jgi:hypothetical protein
MQPETMRVFMLPEPARSLCWFRDDEILSWTDVIKILIRKARVFHCTGFYSYI